MTAENILYLASHNEPLPHAWKLPDGWLYEIAQTLCGNVNAGIYSKAEARQRWEQYAARWQADREKYDRIFTISEQLEAMASNEYKT